MQDVKRVRFRMATWFVASAGIVLVTLAGVLFFLLVRERSLELTRDLEQQTSETIKAAAIIAGQQQNTSRVAAEAVSELSTEKIPLYLFDASLRYIGDSEPPTPVYDAARRALRDDIVRDHFNLADQTWRVVAQTFSIRQTHFVVVAVADESVLDLHYTRLIQLFAIAALLGVLLLGISGYYFAGRAIQPIIANAEATRRFVTDAAHELRTPVAAVRAHAEVALQRTDLDESATTTLRTILNESSRLSSLVADLLTLARADVGERVARRDSFFLDDVVSDATASVSAIARSRDITLAQGRYEQARMVGDPVLVQQLLTILLDNALKYTPAGGAVTTHVYSTDGAAVLAVEDNGIGIPAEELARVFERFFRGEDARRASSGAGLGLSIARWIAQSHNAEIKVESERGAGARFEVRFPAES